MSLNGEEREARVQINPVEKARGSDPNSCGSKLKPANPNRTSYRECLKNHAANIGGNVTDGCGEFMPGGDEGTLEALNCAACSCHRNFHRKESHPGEGGAVGSAMVHPLQLTPPLPSPSFSHHRMGGGGGGGAHWGGSMMQPVRMAFGSGGGGGGGGGTDSSSEELNFSAFHPNAVAPPPPQKRFRSKFTAAQKEKMLEFAEKVGWRIPREDDAELQRFCAEVGVKRQVFKVWMHNNKNISSNKTPQQI